MNRRRRLVRIYGRIGRVYLAWGPRLLLLAAIVFIPLGFVDALLEGVDTDSLNITSGFQVAALISALAAITASGLFGEVFFSGAIAASLTHPEDEESPGFIRLARHISYGKLIAVDLLFVLMMVVGTIAIIVPGILVFVYLSLSGPVVELEKLGVVAGFKRSFQLVRGHFWMAAAILIPVEIVGDAINDAIVGAAHHLLGHHLMAAWAGEAVGNIVTAPVASVAFVLLTLDLIHHRDGVAPRLKRRPEATGSRRAAA
jgi:flagellar biosynthesis protein FlhB